jgi:hypothetical protein
MEHSIYKIVRNSNDRRILVINQYVDVENSEELQEDKFDIVYLNITNMSNNEFGLLLEKTSPIFSTKCWMKPRFVQANTSERLGMLHIVVDGVANSPFDDIVTQRSEISINKSSALASSNWQVYLPTSPSLSACANTPLAATDTLTHLRSSLAFPKVTLRFTQRCCPTIRWQLVKSFWSSTKR